VLAGWHSNYTRFPTMGLPPVRESISPLLRLLRADSDLIRKRALFALAEYEADGVEAASQITQYLDSSDIELRCLAAYAMGRVSPCTPGTADAVLRALRVQNLDSLLRM